MMGDVNQLYSTRTPRASKLYTSPESRAGLCNMIADCEQTIRELRQFAALLMRCRDSYPCMTCALHCEDGICRIEQQADELGVEYKERPASGYGIPIQAF